MPLGSLAAMCGALHNLYQQAVSNTYLRMGLIPNWTLSLPIYCLGNLI